MGTVSVISKYKYLTRVQVTFLCNEIPICREIKYGSNSCEISSYVVYGEVEKKMI